MKKILFCITIGVFLAISCDGKIKNNKTQIGQSGSEELAYWDTKDSLAFSQLPVSYSTVIEWAKFFLETPYEPFTLEVGDDQKTIINFEAFDCTTFVENVLVLASVDTLTHDSFSQKLTEFRYRKSKPLGYPSRLHYFSEWIRVNQKKGFIEDVTPSIGGVKVSKTIDFMTEHRESYSALKENEENYQKIKEIEKKLSLQSYYIIPKKKLKTYIDKIKNGDVVAMATDIKGLDFVHLGFAIWVDGKLHLLHASSAEMKVVISRDDLISYVNKSTHISGIAVIRLVKDHDR